MIFEKIKKATKAKDKTNINIENASSHVPLKFLYFRKLNIYYFLCKYLSILGFMNFSRGITIKNNILDKNNKDCQSYFKPPNAYKFKKKIIPIDKP